MQKARPLFWITFLAASVLVAGCGPLGSTRCGKEAVSDLRSIARRNRSKWLPDGVPYADQTAFTTAALAAGCCGLRPLSPPTLTERVFTRPSIREAYWFKSYVITGIDVASGRRIEESTESTVNHCGDFIETLRESHYEGEMVRRF